MKSRIRQSKINVMYGFISKISMMLLEFISRYFFIKYLGSELLGVNGVFTNVIQCLSLAELGMNNVVMFSYYKPLADNDTRKLSALNSFYRKIYNWIAITVMILGLSLIPFLKYLINVDIEISQIVLIYLLYLADTVVSYLCIYKITVLNADQNAYIGIKYDVVLNIVRTICQIFTLILWKNFLVYLAIKIIFSALGNVLKARISSRKYLFTQVNEELSNNEKKSILETIKSGFIYKLSAVLLNSTDNVLISSIVSTIIVGYLSNYITICNAVCSFVAIVYNNLTASIGNLVVRENKDKRLEVFNIMSVASNWIAFVCFTCTLILIDEFISLWLGRNYVMHYSVVLPKVMMLYVFCVMQPIYSFREALGLYTKTKYIMLLSAIINIVLSIVMGLVYGTSGILIASLIAVGLTYFWYEPYVLYRDSFGTPVWAYYFRIIKNIAICGASTVILKKLIALIPLSGWIGIIIKGIILFLITNVECFIIYGNSNEFKVIEKKFIKKPIFTEIEK